jgi:TolB-like protein/DNA-binding winged helix-turn-helix (wHTH) protein/thioredoxin-like negative regulator of GroEL
MERTRPAHPAPDRGEAFLVNGLRVVPNAGRISGPGADEQVDPKVMEVLVALARRPGDYVSREALIDEVWPDRVVTDHVLSRCVYELRKHLVRAGGSRKYKELLETLPKRGYRLNAEVVPDHPTSPSLAKPHAAGWRGIVLLAALGVVAGAWWAVDRAGGGRMPEVHVLGPVSVAVLPFVDLSAEGDQEYFADGMSEELINVLTRIPGLQVIARSSSFWFKGRNPDIATVAEKLNVTHVLEGSVRRSGDRVRITAQLIDAADSLHLWSETYDREFGDIFAIQDEIALAVAEKLELAFRGDDPAPSVHSPDPEAYALNLHAWFLFNRRAPGDLDHAEAYYRRALGIDPEYAAAWAGLAGVHFIQAMEGERDLASGLALAREVAERAVELDPELPEARARLARVLNTIGERDAGATHMAKAVEYGQDSPLVLSMQAGAAWLRRDFDEAIALNRRAVAHDPLNAVIRENLATHLLSAGRLEEAEQEARVALEINPGADSSGQYSRLLADVLILQRRPTEALGLIANWPEGSARDRALALIHAMDGQSDPFDTALARLVARADLASAMALADVYAFTGDTDAAFGWLDFARERFEVEAIENPVIIWRVRAALNTSPFLDPLRPSPRWEDRLADW